MDKFNLTEKPWIPCLMLKTNETKELSLFEVLSQAQDIKEIVDNSPLVVFSLHRLLLVILHRVFGPENYGEWKNLWKTGFWDTEKLRSYFANPQHQDRFNLFDEERPFYQYPRVTKKEGKEADILPIEVLMQEKATGNNATLFDHSFEAKSNGISGAEAARYLIARHSFSFAGGVSFPFNFSNGLLVSGFSVLAMSEKNLFETLALNLMIYNRHEREPFPSDPDDAPFWERKYLTQANESDKSGTLTKGYLDYLTWQSRRIKLIRDGEKVIGCQLQQNFKLNDEPKIYDPFKVYVAGDNGFYPLSLREDKSLWRNSHTLLLQAGQTINNKKRASLFDHLSTIENFIADGEIEGVENHSFSIFGVINDKANVKLWTHEKLPLPLIYLKDNDLLDDLKNSIQFAEDIGSNLRYAVKILAENLDTDIENFSAMSVYWASLEIKFHRLVADLPKDKEAAMLKWFRLVEKTARNAFYSTAGAISLTIEEKAIVKAEEKYHIGKRVLIHGTKDGKKTGNPIYSKYLPKKEREATL